MTTIENKFEKYGDFCAWTCLMSAELVKNILH